MRCLVIGAKGMLGRELVSWLRREHEEVVSWDLPQHDITDVEKTINGIHRVGPDIIFHLAAWTDVDGCEKDPSKAASVNFQGAWGASLGAAETGCKLLYMSTDYVFDGRSKRTYKEKDKPNPLSVYGRTKAMGEKAVRKSCSRSYIVRTSGLYGRYGRNFVDTIRTLAGKKRSLEVVADQVSSPTYARDLCRPLLELSRSDKYGIYHLTNSGYCSWFELAGEVVRITGADCRVVPVDTARINRPAPRPSFSVLENRNFRKRFGHVLRPWQDALKEYLSEAPTA